MLKNHQVVVGVDVSTSIGPDVDNFGEEPPVNYKMIGTRFRLLWSFPGETIRDAVLKKGAMYAHR